MEEDWKCMIGSEFQFVLISFLLFSVVVVVDVKEAEPEPLHPKHFTQIVASWYTTAPEPSRMTFSCVPFLYVLLHFLPNIIISSSASHPLEYVPHFHISDHLFRQIIPESFKDLKHFIRAAEEEEDHLGPQGTFCQIHLSIVLNNIKCNVPSAKRT